MARKAESSTAAAAAEMTPPPDVEGAIIDAALLLAADRSWSGLALADIAVAAGVPLVDLYASFASKPAILKAFAGRIDRRMVALAVEADASPRDRLFEVLMHRFDLLGPYKAGLRGLANEARHGRLDGLALACRLPRSLAWVLETAGIASSGLAGAVRVRLLGLAYLASLRVWLADDSLDLARTMASLDRVLKRIEPLMRFDSRAAAA